MFVCFCLNSHAVVRLGLSLFPLFALALDLPENFFDDKTTKPAAIMRLLHYPPQPAQPLDRVLGIGAHTEYVFAHLLRTNRAHLKVATKYALLLLPASEQ
jgi:isopenicillin N synthase-like dioxygenase